MMFNNDVKYSPYDEIGQVIFLDKPLKLEHPIFGTEMCLIYQTIVNTQYKRMCKDIDQNLSITSALTL